MYFIAPLRFLALLAYLVAVPTARAQARGDDAVALRGLPAVRVLLEVSDDLVYAHLDTTALRTTAELELRRSGIKVRPDAPAALSLVLTGHRLQMKDGVVTGYAFALASRVLQHVRVPGVNVSTFIGIVWENGFAFGVSNSDTSNLAGMIRGEIIKAADALANDWLRTNPLR